MIQKIRLFPFYFLLLSCTTISGTITPENEECALYALSSLTCHINQKLEPSIEPKHDQIHFYKKDVDALWQRALNSHEAIHIKKARHYYHLSQNALNEQQSRLYLDNAKQLIQASWEKLNPFRSKTTLLPENQHYLLPNDHWLKLRLDNIFTQWDASRTQDLLEKAGFITLCKRSSNMIVAKNKEIPGYLIKIYLQSDKPNQTWKWLINRSLGAENIRNLIKSKKLHYFTVPDKWIYPLPNEDVNTENMRVSSGEKIPAILIATRMKIGTLEESKFAWKNKITHKHLRELYCILSHGFASCYLPQNIPYTKEGKFTCLDTEYPFRSHRLERIRSKLSDEMAAYWDHLIKTGGDTR